MIPVGQGVRRFARAAVPARLRAAIHLVRAHARIARGQGLGAYLRWTMLKARLAARRPRVESVYQFVSGDAARAQRRSETVFVFGSGYSLTELRPDEWALFAAHDTLGFSGFIYQRWVRTDFHLVRGWDYGEAEAHRRWLRSARAYATTIAENPQFSRTVFVLQDEYPAVFARTLLGYRLLPGGARVVPYRTFRDDSMLPSRRLEDGLTHGTGTLCDAVNLAYVLGWTRIVLVGVDLYDSRYFWAPPESTIGFADSGEMVATRVNFRGTAAVETHPVVRNGLIDLMAQWGAVFRQHGVRLEVYNRRSLLTAVLPPFDPSSLSHGEGSPSVVSPRPA